MFIYYSLILNYYVIKIYISQYIYRECSVFVYVEACTFSFNIFKCIVKKYWEKVCHCGNSKCCTLALKCSVNPVVMFVN